MRSFNLLVSTCSVSFSVSESISLLLIRLYFSFCTAILSASCSSCVGPHKKFPPCFSYTLISLTTVFKKSLFVVSPPCFNRMIRSIWSSRERILGFISSKRTITSSRALRSHSTFDLSSADWYPAFPRRRPFMILLTVSIISTYNAFLFSSSAMVLAA